HLAPDPIAGVVGQRVIAPDPLRIEWIDRAVTQWLDRLRQQPFPPALRPGLQYLSRQIVRAKPQQMTQDCRKTHDLRAADWDATIIPEVVGSRKRANFV